MRWIVLHRRSNRSASHRVVDLRRVLGLLLRVMLLLCVMLLLRVMRMLGVRMLLRVMLLLRGTRLRLMRTRGILLCVMLTRMRVDRILRVTRRWRI